MKEKLLFFLFILAMLNGCKSPLYRSLYGHRNEPSALYPNFIIVEVNELDSISPCNEQLRSYSDFCISQYEITNAQFAFFLNDIADSAICRDINLYIVMDSSHHIWQGEAMFFMVDDGYENKPATNVTVRGARLYGFWLTQHFKQYFHKKKYGKIHTHCRLPKYKEWLYAATAKKQKSSYSNQNLEQIAWYKNNSTSTQVVGKKLPNGIGIYDMHGNVAEWCHYYNPYNEDYNIPTIYGVTGGSFLSDSTYFNSFPCDRFELVDSTDGFKIVNDTFEFKGIDSTRRDIGFRIVQSYGHQTFEEEF